MHEMAIKFRQNSTHCQILRKARKKLFRAVFLRLRFIQGNNRNPLFKVIEKDNNNEFLANKFEANRYFRLCQERLAPHKNTVKKAIRYQALNDEMYE
ncbi:hypothetical protein P5673_023921 [Acropora cervicornis]|uniref:Uncharacterized protein n=1 Tax=Acropora cervicornis TaxID=6130 RepID=A0AAD9Q4B2_ACRCE|nr:hypothetical protein P5673_023921 [Acropora cervicornis]